MSVRFAISFAVFMFVLGAVRAHAQPAPNACAGAPCIQIGSYNLELFGSQRKPYGGVDRGPRSDQELDRLVERIATTLDLEVVVFQEINKTSDEWAKFKSKLAAHGYKFLEGDSSDRKQFVVLAWDADEVALQDGLAGELSVRNEFDLDNGCHEEGLRKPLAARFKAGEFDFWIVGVHLKSRSGTPLCTSRIRAEQCQDLVAAINTLVESTGERDVLIVGDCNEELGHDSFAALVDAGFISQMKFLADHSAKGSYIKTANLNQSDDLIDHVWLRYWNTREVVKHSANVMPIGSQAEAKKYIIEQSDHVPVWVSFRIDEDLDDDDAD